MRYSDKDGNIRFNDFVACYIKLKTMTSNDADGFSSVLGLEILLSLEVGCF